MDLFASAERRNEEGFASVKDILQFRHAGGEVRHGRNTTEVEVSQILESKRCIILRGECSSGEAADGFGRGWCCRARELGRRRRREGGMLSEGLLWRTNLTS